MATTNVTASLQGIISKIGFNTTWSAMRNATSGDSTSTYTSATNVAGAITAEFESGRFGSFGGIARTYLFFDLDSISTTITGLSLQIPGVSNNTSSVIPIEGTAWGGGGGTTSLTNAMFNDLNFNRAYASSTSNWSTSGNNSITLNSNALSQIASASTFKVMCMESTHDMRDIIPTTTNMSGMIYANQAGTSSDPYLDVTEAVAVTDNATFFGCNF